MTQVRGGLVLAAVGAFALPLAACGLLFPTVLESATDAGGDDAGARLDAPTGDDATSPSDAALAADTPAFPDATDASPEAVASDDAAPDAGTCDASVDADPDNCGWCGHACRTGACTGGLCVQQIAFFGDTSVMAYENGTIYFPQSANSSDAGIYTVDLASSVVTPLVLGGQNKPQLLVAHAPYLAWGTADGAVRRANEDGGAPVTLASGYVLDCLAANSTDFFWWDFTTGNVYRLPVGADGGAPTVYYSSSPSTVGCVAADDSRVAILGPAGLVERDLDAGTTSTVASPGSPDNHNLLITGQDTYWLTNVPNDAGSTVLELAHAVTGSSVVGVSAEGYFQGPTKLAGANGGVFWAANPDVYGCEDPACTGGVRLYSTSTPFGNGTVADSTWIYVASTGSGHVVKFAQ
jgi:hypothetical protein